MKTYIYNKVAENSPSNLEGQLGTAIRLASVLCTLCSVLLLSACTQDEIIAPQTPEAAVPQGMKTLTVDFQLPEGKPGFGEGETRATYTDGTWQSGDELMMNVDVLNADNQAFAHFTLVHDGTAWDVNVDKSYVRIYLNSTATNYSYADYPILTATQDLTLTEGLTLRLDEDFGEATYYSVKATYAPEMERDGVGEYGEDLFKLKADATTTAPEQWTATASGEDGSLALQWSTTNQARLRIYTGAKGDEVTLTSQTFVPSGDKPADGIYTATTQADGYACFYGWLYTDAALTSDFNVSLTSVTVGEDEVAFTCPLSPVTLLEASTLVPVTLEATKSYKLDAADKRAAAVGTIAVIDGTCSSITGSTDDERLAKVKAQIETYLAEGKTTFVVTGASLAMYSGTVSMAKTVVGEAIRRLGGGTAIDFVLLDATELDSDAFYGCNALASVMAPAATTIKNDAFYGCNALASVSAPAATTIGDMAFYQCASLTSVSIPSATTIGSEAFYGCNALASVSAPSATTIGNDAFYQCTSLTSVSLPSAKTIEQLAFNYCSAITNLTFGTVIETVGTGAFDAFTSSYNPTCALTLHIDQLKSTGDLKPSGNTWAGKTWKSISYVDDEGNAVSVPQS